MKDDNITKTAIIVFIFNIIIGLVSLGIVGLVIYAIIHFATKFW